MNSNKKRAEKHKTSQKPLSTTNLHKASKTFNTLTYVRVQGH